MWRALRCSGRLLSSSSGRLSKVKPQKEADTTWISLSHGGKKLRTEWSGGTSSSYHAVWLRHNCQCPQCLSEYNQLLVQSHDVDPRVTITHCSLKDGERVDLKWSCGHEGHLDVSWLKTYCYSREALEKRRESSAPTLPEHQAILPYMKSQELQDEKGVLRWLKMLSEHGMCLLTGVPCTDEGGLEVARLITPHLQETFYGGHTRIKVFENPINVSYGPNPLEPHMDVPGYESIPGLNFLQCIRNDECVEGGESIIVDTLAVVENLRSKYPQHFNTLVRVPATFQRIHYERDNPVHMVYRTPHIHLNKHGEIVSLRWSPHNHGPLLAPEEDVEPYYEAFALMAKSVKEDLQFQIRHRLQPGDVLTMNNHRMLHGRTVIKLNGGVRNLNNFALNIDEFKSRLMVLCAKYDPDYQPKNILNHDFSYSTAAI